MAERAVVVNADDFGLSPGVNRGIVEAYQHGIVTSTSVMVLQPAAAEAPHHRAQCPNLSFGLHLDLCEWTYERGQWSLRYQRADADDPAAVAAELDRQLRAFDSLLGAEPTHIDSHQHVADHEPVASIVADRAARLGIPVRRGATPATYCGDFYGRSGAGEPLPDFIGVDALLRLLEDLPPGLTEVACHAGFAEDTSSSYRLERRTEVATLCDPRVRDLLETAGIDLVAFADLRRAGCAEASAP